MKQSFYTGILIVIDMVQNRAQGAGLAIFLVIAGILVIAFALYLVYVYTRVS